jgi:hypothetical protein
VVASTPEQFSDMLDQAYSWRLSELQALKGAVREIGPADLQKPYARMILRAGVALLYAHWEGYAKQALQHYVDYVAKRRLRYKELIPELASVAMRPVLERALRDQSALSAFAEDLSSFSDKRAQIPKSGVVDTGSNLRYDRLLHLLTTLGLDSAAFDMRKHLIDVRLCDARNEIAHGGISVPESESVVELIGIVLEMMSALRSDLTNVVATKAYRVVA